MANHVSTYISFYQISDEGKARLQEILSRTQQSERNWFGDIFVDGKENSPTYEDTQGYDWNINNVGSKWCYIEDSGEDYLYLVSAWSYPAEGVNWLIEQIGEVDPSLIAVSNYEDEMPNFFGSVVYNAYGGYDNIEWSYEDLVEELWMDHPEMEEEWDEDEEEGSDEYWDIFNEHSNDKINEMQEAFSSELIEYLKNGGSDE